MPEFDALQWTILSVAAVMIGVSKTGLPGIGILSILMVAWVIPAKTSTGLILPMLIVGDVFAVSFYRRHAEWPHLVRMLPWAVAGVCIGCWALKRVNDAQLRPIIGTIILVMLAVNVWRERNRARAAGSGSEPGIPTHWSFAAVMGLAAGVTTMMANAAGPIMSLYLLAMRMPKHAFIGTGAWYFLLVNCFKVPFSASLDLINPASLKVNLILAPAIVAGSLVGLVIATRIPERVFNAVVQILAAAAAVKLLF